MVDVGPISDIFSEHPKNHPVINQSCPETPTAAASTKTCMAALPQPHWVLFLCDAVALNSQWITLEETANFCFLRGWGKFHPQALHILHFWFAFLRTWLWISSSSFLLIQATSHFPYCSYHPHCHIFNLWPAALRTCPREVLEHVPFFPLDNKVPYWNLYLFWHYCFPVNHSCLFLKRFLH